MPDIRPTAPPGGTACREMLRAIGEALRLPAPATRADEISYHRLRSQRASVAVDAINRILASRDADGIDMQIEADTIRGLIAGLKPTI